MSVSDEKTQLRRTVIDRRDALPQKQVASQRIWDRVFSLPQYQAAETVLFYVDARSEVRTQWLLPEVLTGPKRVIVPYCVEKHLELFWLQSMEDLERGRFGILEPRQDLREMPDRRVLPDALDCLIVPGVAFDRDGHRLGHGWGFYDRLLAEIRADAFTIGLAFECQIVESVPTEPHDLALDAVISENAIYSNPISPR